MYHSDRSARDPDRLRHPCAYGVNRVYAIINFATRCLRVFSGYRCDLLHFGPLGFRIPRLCETHSLTLMWKRVAYSSCTGENAARKEKEQRRSCRPEANAFGVVRYYYRSSHCILVACCLEWSVSPITCILGLPRFRHPYLSLKGFLTPSIPVNLLQFYISARGMRRIFITGP